MRFITLLFLILAIQFNGISQTKFFQSYEWVKNPVCYKASEEDKKTDYFVISDKHVFEYAYDSNHELNLFETRHVITHVNTSKGVENTNKMYIPASRIIETIILKARCITSTGKVINLDKNSFKDVDNLEDKGAYIIFAYEGLEPNCDIEYIYTVRRNVMLFGSFYTEFSFPQLSAEIDLFSPRNLIFDLKSQNGFAEFKTDTLTPGKNHYAAKSGRIEGEKNEIYSADDANLKRFDFHLRMNLAKSKSKMYTWNLIGNDLVKRYTLTSKDDVKAISKLIQKANAQKQSTDEEKIFALETYIKKTIAFIENSSGDVTLEKAINEKVVNAFMLNQIFIEATRQMGISFEYVFTNNRFRTAFDGSFEGLIQLEEMLIYYPSFNKFLTPANYFSRLGFMPSQFTGNKGLFVKETEVGGVVAAISKIKQIGYTEIEKSQTISENNIKFSDDFLTTSAVTYSLTGYAGYHLQPIYYLLNEEKKKEEADVLLKLPGDQTIVKSYSAKNYEPEDMFRKPLIIQGNVILPQLIEKAGNKYLFKVGAIIGPQAELYQEKERKRDIVLQNTHGYVRLINIEIPAGYKISNVNDINKSVKLLEDGKESAYFVSSFTQEGNLLKINVAEQYTTLFYPKEKFNEYKAVINAAADFNKLTLILEK